MLDYSALRVELAKPAYTALTDAQAATALTTTFTSNEDAISTAAVARLWARRNVLGVARERAGRAALTIAQRERAWQVIEMVERDGFADLDPRDPAKRAALVAFLDALVADGVMVASDKTATLALAVPARTIAEAIGCGDMMAMDAASAERVVAYARAQGV
jgi:hypothetical protein